MHLVLLFILYFRSQCAGSFQRDKETIASYADCLKSDFQRGKILQSFSEPQSKIGCAMKCLRKSSCTTAVIDEKDSKCFLSSLNKKDIKELEKQASFSSQSNGRFAYIQMLGPEVGKEYVPYKNKVFKNCKALKVLHPDAPSGLYWINPVNPELQKPFQAYCDQETSGGGWTLVWTYAFTDYRNFDSVSNAVTPLPAWRRRPGPPGRTCQPTSKTTPVNEEQTGAMPFSLWSKIGEEFLVKSKIMNWISCKPSTGSFVKERIGSISCRVVRNVIGRCDDIVPTLLMRRGPACGLALVTKRRFPGPGRCTSFINFNGDVRRGWPVHDSCGTCKQTQLNGVATPRGNVFIR